MAQNCHPQYDKSWIFDCGATDTMTYELSDIIVFSKHEKTHIRTANGGIMAVKTGGVTPPNLGFRRKHLGPGDVIQVSQHITV